MMPGPDTSKLAICRVISYPIFYFLCKICPHHIHGVFLPYQGIIGNGMFVSFQPSIEIREVKAEIK